MLNNKNLTQTYGFLYLMALSNKCLYSHSRIYAKFHNFIDIICKMQQIFAQQQNNTSNKWFVREYGIVETITIG